MRKWIPVLCLVVLPACTKRDEQPTPESAAVASAPARTFSIADFGHLRYLEGTWRGEMANGNPFFESYHFLNDSTVLKGSHTDATFKTKSDSSLIVIRNGVVMDSSANAVYVAESLDAGMVDFRASPTYHFTWTRDGTDGWTARLYSKKSDGTENVTTYVMKRAQAPELEAAK